MVKGRNPLNANGTAPVKRKHELYESWFSWQNNMNREREDRQIKSLGKELAKDGVWLVSIRFRFKRWEKLGLKEMEMKAQGKVLCEGCLAELAHKINETYKFRYLLERTQKKLTRQKKQLKQFNERWKELRKVLAKKGMPDICKNTNIQDHFNRFKEKEL